MRKVDTELEGSTRVRAGGICLVLGAIALALGGLANIGNGFTYDSKMHSIGATVPNELGAQISTVLLAMAGYLLLAGAICLSGAVRGRGSRLTQAGVIMLGLGSMLVAMVFTTTGPLQMLEAAKPPAGATTLTVLTVIRHQTDAWSFIAIGLVLPCFLLAPFVLGAGLRRAGLIPIWPVLLWILFAVAGFLPPAMPMHDLLGGTIAAVGMFGSLGWMGLAVVRRARAPQPAAVGVAGFQATAG